jgi:gliding motility-associated-like protein
VGNSHDFGIPSTAGSVYDWNVQNSSIATIVSGNGTELITIDLNSTGVFKLVVEETNQDGCLGYDSLMVEIHDLPSADIVALGPLTFCNGDNVDLQLNTAESIFAWNNGVNNIVNNITASGNYFATVTDNYGCSVNTNSIDVLVEENPNVDFTIDGFCVGTPTSFVNKSVIDDPLVVINYSWYLDNGAILYHDSTSYTYDNVGDYSVSFVAISDIYCKDSIAKDFTIFGIPEANFTYNPFTVSTLYPQVIFTNTSLNAAPVLWTFNDTTTSVDENPVYSFYDPGMYEVWLTVEDDNQCIDSVQKQIKVYYDYILHIPTAFTPNDDGNNDSFGPSGLRMKKYKAYQFIIYNKWGDKVFETTDVLEQWGGIGAPTDVYSWVLLITDELGAVRKENGLVTLIR